MSTENDLTAWPSDLVSIFEAIGKRMGGKRLTPELVSATSDAWRCIIPAHEASITHGVKGTVDAHHYIIQLAGPRWIGPRWRLRSGIFERLCRAAVEGANSN